MKSSRSKRSEEVVNGLRDLLKLTGLTQRDLAKHLSTTPSHLNLYFKNKSDMHSAKLVETLHFLGIDLASLIDERVSTLKKANGRVDASSLYLKLQNIKEYNKGPLLKIIKTLAG
jgi:transcriptional regulator with XRE-family HTH domain